MKKGRAISTTVAAVIFLVIVAAAGGSYYYYAQISTTPQKTIGVVFDIGGRGDLSFNDMAALGADNAARTVLGCPNDLLVISSTLAQSDFACAVTPDGVVVSYVGAPKPLAFEESFCIRTRFIPTGVANTSCRVLPRRTIFPISGSWRL